MSNYSIRDLEQLSGIKAHTIRIWEQRYNIINPKRTDTNIRTYDDTDLKLVLNIALLKEHDYKISEIARMSLDELNQEVRNLTEKNLHYPDQIHAMTLAMIDFDEERFERTLQHSVIKFGFENTMINIIYPFLNRVGILWVTGSIGPAQEHFMSNLIRQKLIVAIDGQVIKLNEGSEKFVLFLPEGEFHEIGLLFANYILRARNNKVIYLGQSLPMVDLEFVCQTQKPDYLFCSIISVPNQDDVQAYINLLGEKFPTTTILLTGYQVIGQDLSLPENCQIITNIRQLIEVAS